MECLYCNGEMIRGTAPFSASQNGYHIVWKSIPAWVCAQCGEPLFEEAQVNHIQRAVRQIDLDTIALTSKAA
uniref:YgiT-type zinc finger domain-containing protein n=1 Tax=Candidatus Kentrum sp. LPFa TaxID=2126335 RepID=A0A450W241_9GAMM|nr:MAG: YgiT-type zinc finger domain-containing protein [Candidatus Kentron sp. LPFa]